MKSKKFLISAGIILVSIFVISSIVFAVTKLTPSASPSSTYHSLNDIYTLITTGTEKTTPNSALTTSSSPSATTSHSTTEIYLLLANKFKQENLRPGTNIFGITGAYGTPDTNYVLATSSAVSSLTPTYTTTDLASYTLEDIYNLINDTGTRITEPNHTFSSSPSASMHTTTEIYDRLASLKPVLTATRFGTSTSIFGVTGTFSPTAQVNESCGSNDECYTGYCGDLNYWYGDPVCTDGSIGSYCAMGSSCTSGYCDTNDGICSDGTLGQYCGDDSDCDPSLFCDTYIDYTYQCTKKLCTSNEECVSNGLGNYCGIDGNGKASCTNGQIGASCNSDTQCDSPNVCSPGNKCVAIIGNTCTSNSGCLSGWCNTQSNICKTDGNAGSVCGGSFDCNTYNCISNVCSADLPPLTSALIGYWKLDDTGSSFTDSSGSGNIGSCSDGCPSATTGKLGGAQNFDGEQLISLGTPASLQGANSFTIGAWVYLTSDPSNYDSTIVGSETWDGPGRIDFSVRSGDIGNSLYGDEWGNNTGYPDYGTVPLALNTWYYVTWVKNGDTDYLYVNGALDISQVLEGPVADTGNISIGDFYGRKFVGKLDEVAIWARPLSPADITNLYNGGAGRSITP